MADSTASIPQQFHLGFGSGGNRGADRRERRTKFRLGSTEASVSDRMRELDAREAEIDRRRARLEADFELRDVKLEERERQIADLEQRLARKETDLSRYVDQVQSEMDRREADWWEKQLGKKPSPTRSSAAAPPEVAQGPR